MTRTEASEKATATMLAYLRETKEHTRDAAKAFGLTFRELSGRWNVYSMDIDQWHVMVSDNGGKVEQIIDCSNV